jgi:choline dehydrogenase-like flavoprotein
VLPGLLRRGLRLEADLVAVRLVSEGRRITAVECVPRSGGAPLRFSARTVVLSAGALGSPHLVLASGLERLSPAPHAVGRYLMRHYNAVVVGVFPRRPDPEAQFHKQLAIHDDYFGNPASGLGGKLGALQQLSTPPGELIKAYLPGMAGSLAVRALPHATGLLVMAEDQPRAENRVAVERSRTDRFGLPELQITHRYTPRDLAAGAYLVQRARQVLRAAGAWATYVQPVRTFSHAVGTLRMGLDPGTSVLDPECLFRGSENLYVVDASCFPSSAAVNPSLTIAANALRVGRRLAAAWPRRGASAA